MAQRHKDGVAIFQIAALGRIYGFRHLLSLERNYYYTKQFQKVKKNFLKLFNIFQKIVAIR